MIVGGESAYSPAMLGIDMHCGQIRRSAPTAWIIAVFRRAIYNLSSNRVDVVGKRDSPIGSDCKALVCEQRPDLGQQGIAMDLGGDLADEREMRLGDTLENK